MSTESVSNTAIDLAESSQSWCSSSALAYLCSLAAVVALAIQPMQAGADYTITRLTPNSNPGSLPHAVDTALHLPVDVDQAPGNTDYLFVSQLGGLASDGSDGDDITKADGRIVLVDRSTGTVDFTSPFLSIGDTNTFDPVPGAPEVGLFSTAFHPDFAGNGKFYVSVAVNYPGPAPSLQPRDPRSPPFKLAVREYVADPNDIQAGATFSKTIFEVDQPSFNHNGSWLGFNPVETASGDNYLYVTLGDGGDQHDPYDYGQDKDYLLGTVMRIDIDGDDFADPDINYAIPNDNPFVGTDGRDEIWAYGLRNPWRASFDRVTGDMYIGDVGQFTWEEINYLPGDIGPEDDRNFGWRDREGFVSTPSGGVGDRQPADNVDPIIAVGHGFGQFQGNSIAGGIVYRGPVEEFYGMYIFADSISGNIWGIDVDNIGMFDEANPGDSLVLLNDAFAPEDGSYVSIVSFAEDEEGNLLIVDHGYDGAGLGGNVYRLDFVLSGDYNDNGIVDAADYTVWRNNIGASAGTLPNDAHDGPIGVAQYNTWRANFGQPGLGTENLLVVPEPATLVLALSAAGLTLIFRRWRSALLVVALFAAPANLAFAITGGQTDNFQSSTVEGWGPDFSRVASVALDSGPAGMGDHALFAATSSPTRAGSRLIVVNNDQWTGDWTEAGVVAVEFDAYNPNGFELDLWLGITGLAPPGSAGSGSTFVSLDSARLDVGTDWERYTIGVTPADFEQATNHASGSIADALANVAQFRIFHNIDGRIHPTTPNNFIGDVVDAGFYIDNISSVTVPEPNCLTLLVAMVCLPQAGRRKRANAIFS